jgi:uncharacterized hydrophobic protein (TIGR00271 family)
MPIKFFPFLNNKQRRTIYQTIREDATGSAGYYFIVVLGAVVATLGLLTNNIAVIIGAMLISPIMNPLIGVSISIATGDSELFGQSFKALILGILLALGVSYLMTLAVPVRELTDEILSRTRPTTIDLVIAFASGAAGAFTIGKKTGLMILPGVAIATAIMPPICVVGAGLAFSNFGVSIGGALLFLSNLIAINLAAAIIFKIMGFSISIKKDPDNQMAEAAAIRQHKKRFIVSVVAFAVILLPLSFIMYNTIQTDQTENTIKASLESALSDYRDVGLVSYSYNYEEGIYYIDAVINAETKPTEADVLKIEEYLTKELQKPAKVKLTIIFSAEVDVSTASGSG